MTESLPMGMHRMRVLVLGCGSIGRRHIRNLQALGRCAIAAYDVDAARRSEVDAMTGVTAIDSMERAWAFDPQVVIVATPTDSHVSLAVDAARRGCHLFIEKPLSYSMADVDALAAVIDQRGLISMVGCNMRFHFGPRTVHEWLGENAVGQVVSARIQCGSYLPRWRPASDYRNSYSADLQWGGAILDCIHEIDLALWHFGPAEVAASVVAPAWPIGLETDGLAEVILRHDCGVISSIHLSFVQRDYRRCCQIIGTAGSIYWDFEHGAVIQYGEHGRICRRIAAADDHANSMYIDEMAHFFDAVSQHRAAMNGVDEAAHTLRVALEARQQGWFTSDGNPESPQSKREHVNC